MEFRKANWLVISGVTGAAIVGVTGLALANGGNGDNRLPDGISLDDRVPVTRQIEQTPAFDVVPRPIIMDDSNDSPFDAASASASFDSVDDSDSPDLAPPPPAPAPIDNDVSDDSPFDSFDASVSDDSPDYVAPPSAPVYDDSVNSASFDSPNDS